MKRRLATPSEQQPRRGESFLARFNRLKTAARAADEAAPVAAQVSPPDREPATARPVDEVAVAEPPPLTDADMPPLETLAFDSDYSGFLSPEVSATLRKAALRKLFHATELNVVDGLDEYAEDYTTFETLGDIVTSDMRHQMEVAARREAEKLEQQLLAETDAADGEATGDGAEAAPQAGRGEDARAPDRETPEALACTDDTAAPGALCAGSEDRQATKSGNSNT